MMRPFIFRYSFVTVLLLIASIASLSIGAVFINPFEAVSSLFTQNNFIINEYRAPRMF